MYASVRTTGDNHIKEYLMKGRVYASRCKCMKCTHLFAYAQTNDRGGAALQGLLARAKCAMARRLLLIQHDLSGARASYEALSSEVGQEYCLVRATTCSEGVKRLLDDTQLPEAERLSAVVVDLSLPDSTGIETFDRLFRAAPQIPFLILATPEDEEMAKLAIRRGAQDYISSGPINGRVLLKIVNNMIERAAIIEALYDDRERAQVTLNSIGEAVISADLLGRITYLNSTAESMTGWSSSDAIGLNLTDVFHIIDSTTRLNVPTPVAAAIRADRIVTLTPNCSLIRRDGTEVSIEDSSAPIHDRRGLVTGAVMVFHDVSQTRSMTLRMAHLAQHDDLTDLPNRLLLDERLSHDIALAARSHGILAVLFLDLDRFKHVNDTLGHAVGDRLLQSVGKRLLTCVRSSDTVSRQGGDEFVVLLSSVSHAQAAAVSAQKILSTLSAPHIIDAHEFHLTVSVGISTYPEDGDDPESLMKCADMAMYQAKEKGRNNYQFFKPSMNVKALARQAVESDLHYAIERNEFALEYQPIMNLQTGHIISLEALIRWRRPNGLVSPANFIPVAEDSGQIVAIGQWVLREACRQVQGWRMSGLPAVRVAVNISTAELRHKDFCERVKRILLETGLAPNLLELELTETFLMQDPQSTASVLQSLREYGVHLALDDFGTGYSSLTHLKRFPIDTLKVDRTFIGGLASDADDACIVSAVINMGKSLNMRVVAEGIETRNQLSFLQAYKCFAGQGYFLSRPLSHADCGRMLKSVSGVVIS
jgi:diguanylate cyclase (GGDEF)-like protein/PAS domain S-box-containing protein